MYDMLDASRYPISDNCIVEVETKTIEGEQVHSGEARGIQHSFVGVVSATLLGSMIL
jgi:hypothetical protein